MNVVRVLTNRACNQACGFCNTRRVREDAAALRDAPERLAHAVAAGAREIVLTGGEPTLRADLAALVRGAKSAAAVRVILETNGALVDGDCATALARAGLDVARVHLPAWGEDCDAITGQRGGFDQTLRAFDALHTAGIELEVAIPIVRANLELASGIPLGLVEHAVPVRALSLSIPSVGPVMASVATAEECARAIEAVAQSARQVGLPTRIGDNGFLPPCVFPRPGRVAHLYTLTPGGARRSGFEKVAACQECGTNDRCPGFPRDRLALEPRLGEAVTPIREDRVRRRLSVISSVKAQIARELVTYDVSRGTGSPEAIPTHTVRVVFQCNQACDFCFVSTHLPAPEDEQIRAAIREAGEANAILALSGGEPTLNPRLVDYARLARKVGVRELEVQTNATRLAEPGLLDALVDAGVDTLFISLHGSTAQVCESVTAAPGTFDSTVAGIDAAYRTSLRTRLNFVFCQDNLADFPNVIRLVAARWPRIELTLSFVAPSTDLVPRTRALIPRYSDVLPKLKEGLELARSRGVRVTGFESMCGLPFCLVPEGLERLLGLAALPEGIDRGEFERPEPCSICQAASRCFGVRRGYAELYGTSELRPVLRELG